jgi:hypothetical protein
VVDWHCGIILGSCVWEVEVPNAWRRGEEVQLKRWNWDSHEIAFLVVDLVV